jgi:hypothetical protein
MRLWLLAKTAMSVGTTWRIAERAGIELTAGREAKGKRLSPERRAAVIEARRANPTAPQQEIAHAAGVGRSTICESSAGGVAAQRRYRNPIL